MWFFPRAACLEMKMPFTPRPFVFENAFRLRNGFSLVELLVVVAIIALLAGFAIPAFNSIGQARGVGEAAHQVAAAVELARSQAIARRTYVWLGLQAEENSGNTDLRVGIVYSKDGTTNSAAANLQPVGRSLLIQRVGMVDSEGVPSGDFPGDPRELAGFSGGVVFEIGQAARFTDRRSITFTPFGEVMAEPAPASTTPFDPLLAIGLATARGTQTDADNIVSVAIDGSVGIPAIYRK
jgi:prepilin-type N-terminal cleavage/methylation domain-containing protein